MYPVAMITAPRKTNYISLTLESLFDYGFNNVHVFEEPAKIGLYPNYQHNQKVTRYYNDRKLGCVHNWLNALHVMHRQFKGPIIMCEDDFIILRKFDLSIVDLMSDFGFISPYCSKVNEHEFINCWHLPKMPTTGWCGNLFMVLSQNARQKIIDCVDAFIKYATFQAKEPIHLDYATGKMLEGMYNLTHRPSLIYHTGEESTWTKNNSIKGRTLHSRQPSV